MTILRKQGIAVMAGITDSSSIHERHWDFAGGLATILKAIGGDLYPQRSYACCSRNLQMSPLCNRLRTISGTLGAYWASEKPSEETDPCIATSLGAATPAKRWLAASLDKTIRLQLQSTCDFWLTSFGT